MPTKGHVIPVATQTLAPPSMVEEGEDFRTLVTLARTHPRDVGHRQVIVSIDGGPKVTLLYGESVTYELTPGSHHLRAHNTLVWKNVPFHVETGEHLEFLLINRASPLTLGFLAVLGVAPLFLSVHRRSLL